MSQLQVSEKIIKRDFEKLQTDGLEHFESDLYLKDKIVYKIIKPAFRETRYNSLYIMDEKNYPHANNIINILYQGDKLIGSCTKYLENYSSLSKEMYKLDLYEIKIIMNYIIDFFKSIQKDNLLYWDIHLNNMGISNGNFYIIDIDSMTYTKNIINYQYALNNLITLFYELYYRVFIRNEHDKEYKDIIYKLTNAKEILDYTFTIDKIKNIINNTSKNELEEKRILLKK